MKNYVNRLYIKEKTFNDGGSLLNVSISETALNEMLSNVKKGYVNIVIAKRKQADDYDNTHYAYYNEYTPKEKTEPETATEPEVQESEDDLPF